MKIQPNLKEWLAPIRKPSGSIITSDFRRQFDDARVAARIVKWPGNALRHSFASYHLAHFKDTAALALEMGHTDSGMIFEHYRELVRPREAEKYWNIRPISSGKVLSLAARRNEALKEKLRTMPIKSVARSKKPGQLATWNLN